MKKDLVIIGGGPAGLAAAISAYDNGVRDILVIERDSFLGGILRQCIHNGFGLTRFGENLAGPEYAERFIEELNKRNIEYLLNTTVINLTRDKTVTATNADGIIDIEAKAVVLAMGCRERSKGALNIAGFRPSGLFSAGTAQKYINMKGLGVGNKVVILGSGDIGLIMARRMTLEGAQVLAVCEIMPHSSGLKRNIVQCLDDFNIPLLLSHTIVQIHGKERVEGVSIAKVDENRMPIPSTVRRIDCDTVLFSVGLIPENELSARAGIEISGRTKGAVVDDKRETSVEGVFACGNVLHVHDLVDFVSEEAELAGKSAAQYLNGGSSKESFKQIIARDNVIYAVPQRISNSSEAVKVYFRPTCNMNNVVVRLVDEDNNTVFKRKRMVVAPGEMETVLLKPEVIEGARGDISILIEREDAR